MTNVNSVMFIAFVAIFIIIMTAGLNVSLVNNRSISPNNPMCVNTISSYNLNSTNYVGTINTTSTRQMCQNADAVFVIPCWIGLFAEDIENFVFTVLNDIIMAVTYFSAFMSLLFSPCSIFQNNPDLFAIVFLPLFIGAVYIVVQALKATGGGG